MVIRKFNYFRFFVVLFILIGIIVGSICIINNINYKKTYDYKLTQLGYSESDITLIKSKLTNSKIDKILTINYNEEIINFLNEKYFVFENLDKYLEYHSKHKKYDYKKVVEYINCELDFEWVDSEKETNINDNNLMLVNRIYGLKSDYEPEDLITLSLEYASPNIKISGSIEESIISMIEDAKLEGYGFIVSDGYRSYKDQDKLYNDYVKSYGRSDADDLVAKAGHSEYQTGLSFNIIAYTSTDNEKECYEWLKANAYRYGFIFRFEENKTELTQFNSSSTRLRYVGNEAASIIYNEKICFEEYYAYFVKGTN